MTIYKTTTPEEFENGGFTLKTHQMFSVHTTPEKFENTTITGHFGFFSKTRTGRYQDHRNLNALEEPPFCDGLARTEGPPKTMKLRFQFLPM